MDKRRVNVRAIIWRDGKLLAVKHKDSAGKAADYWALPGGGLDPGEALEAGIRREIVEETGVIPKISRILFGQQLKSSRAGRDEELEFFYHVTNPEAFTHITLNETSHGASELAICEFIDPSKEYILPIFLQTIDIESYIASVQPVFMANYLD